MLTSSGDEFQRFAFVSSYDVEVDPEFPVAGLWAHTVHAFNRDGDLVDKFASNWGAPRALVVHPSDSESWVGLFAHSGLDGVSGVFAMPGSSSLCVSIGGLALVLNVDQPEDGALVASASAQQVVASAVPALLLVSTFTELTAFDGNGIAWRSPRLALYDLRILAIDGMTIRCTGTGDSGSSALIEVNTLTGLPKSRTWNRGRNAWKAI